MSGEVVTGQVEIITAEILVLKNQTAANIIEIGKRLIKAKEMLPHGEWGNWLKDRVEFSHQTANKFMRVAREFENYASMRNLGTAKVFALLELPTDQRDELVSGAQVIPSTGAAKTIDEMTTRELEQVKKAMQDAEQARSALETAQARLSGTEERAREAEAARLGRSRLLARGTRVRRGCRQAGPGGGRRGVFAECVARTMKAQSLTGSGHP